MSFENYWFLLILPILPLFLFWQKRQKKPGGVLISFTKEFIPDIIIRKTPFSYRWPKIFFIAFIVLLIGALAKPCYQYRQKEVIEKGRVFMVLIDFSGSTSDLWGGEPTLSYDIPLELIPLEEKIKSFAVYFISRLLEEDRIYLVPFAGRAFSLGPYSPDKAITLLKQRWFSNGYEGMWDNEALGNATEAGKAIVEALTQLVYKNAQERIYNPFLLTQNAQRAKKLLIIRDALLELRLSSINNSRRQFDTEGLKGNEGAKAATEKEYSTLSLNSIKALPKLDNGSIIILSDFEFLDINSDKVSINWLLGLRLCREVGIQVYGICLGYNPGYQNGTKMKILEQAKEAIENTGGYLYKINRRERRTNPAEATKKIEIFLKEIERLEKAPMVSRAVIVKKDYQNVILTIALLCLSLSIGLPWHHRCRELF